ncbi:hypothetical protein LguiA_031371 [Lonicera macranthoides]
MAGGGASKSSNTPRVRKRVEAETGSVDSSSITPSPSLKRAKDGSAFVRCEGCNKYVPVALVSMHDCGFEARIKMNLEAQVMEMPTEVKKKSVERRKPSSSKGKKATKSKDPNKPKRPPTAFFLFMDEFRKTFKEANPDNKSVSVVAKEGGVKWKSMSDEEKQPFVDKAAELKAEHGKAQETNNDDETEEDGGASQDEEATTEKQAEVETVSDDE